MTDIVGGGIPDNAGLSDIDAKRVQITGCVDDLRTRIAAAIAQADQDWCSDNPLHEDMADAVIRELKLHPVETLDRRYIRWATRWRNNPDWNGGE